MQVDPLKPSQICKNSLGTFYIHLQLNPNHFGQNYSVIVFGEGGANAKELTKKHLDAIFQFFVCFCKMLT